MIETNKIVIAIDFDGTIVEENYPLIGELREGADKYINKLHNEGHTIIIHTCRSGVYAREAFRFLVDKEIEFDYFNENDPRLIEMYDNDSRKISADLYIDDKNLVKLPKWSTKYNIIKKRLYGKEI